MHKDHLLRKMLGALLLLCIFFSGLCNSYSVVYESFTGNTLSPEEIKLHEKHNTTFWCTNEIRKCDPYEFRRIDGSCNNLKSPTRGASHTPNYRILPEYFGKDFGPRSAVDGEPLPSCRTLRTYFLPEGYLADRKFTQLLTYALIFITSDILSFHDTVNYILWKPYCCEPKGKADPVCAPIEVPDDDPVHRFSNIRCLNLTKPETFQYNGCLRKDTPPERILSSTPLFDLSHVYGSSLKSLYEKARLFQGGLLKYEIENGKIWPPSTKTPVNLCLLNQKPHETRCHNTPEDGVNSVLGTNLFTIWTWRLHNRIATELSFINPCWNDERLFYVTREIVIAILLQINYYEMWPALMGRENLIRDNVISSSDGFRNLYNDNIVPQISIEFPIAMRWIHTIQDTNIRMYDKKGHHLKDVKMTNLTLRTGYLVDNIDYITQSAVRQACGKVDYAVDWNMAEAALGPHQRASDVFSSDICKNRLFGCQPYVAYKEFCSGKSYETFEDLLDSIDPERLELMRHKYRHVRDIDLLAGLWFEKFIEGGHVPITFYCLVVEQLIHNIVSDRHWYESEERPNAFTYDQLQAIRKVTIAWFMCAVGDSITHIQPKAFLMTGPGNEICSCEEIEKFDLSPWKDLACDRPYANGYS